MKKKNVGTVCLIMNAYDKQKIYLLPHTTFKTFKESKFVPKET